jgi:solute carrier family 25 phosphate transporter 23/24/25/41
LQVSGWQGARELHSDHGSVVVYRGMVDCFVRTVREEGFQALFKVRPVFVTCCLTSTRDM